MLLNARSAGRFHNPKVGGSIPPPATNKINNLEHSHLLNLGAQLPWPAYKPVLRLHLAQFKFTATLHQTASTTTNEYRLYPSAIETPFNTK